MHATMCAWARGAPSNRGAGRALRSAGSFPPYTPFLAGYSLPENNAMHWNCIRTSLTTGLRPSVLNFSVFIGPARRMVLFCFSCCFIFTSTAGARLIHLRGMTHTIKYAMPPAGHCDLHIPGQEGRGAVYAGRPQVPGQQVSGFGGSDEVIAGGGKGVRSTISLQ